MDAHRLRSVLDRVIGEHARLGIDGKFALVIQALGTCISDPGGPADEELRIHLSSLITALRQARTNDLVESDRRILVEIRGERHTGFGLVDRLTAVASEQPFLPGAAREAMLRIADDLQQFLGVCAAAQAAMQQLSVTAPPLANDRYELGILLPDKLIQGDLDRVLTELKDWNTALGELIPIVSEQKACVVLRAHSTRRFELAVPLDRPSAHALGTAIVGVYEMFQRIMNNRTRTGELERHLYPADLVKRMKEYEQHIIPQAMREIKAKFKETFVKPGSMKPKELDKALERTLRFIAMRIRDGVEVELVGPELLDTTGSGEQPDRTVPHHVRQALKMAARKLPGEAKIVAGNGKDQIRLKSPPPKPGESTSNMTPVGQGEEQASNIPLTEITGVKEEPPSAAA